jgi:hypothetical protein
MTIRLSTGLRNNIVGPTGVAASFVGGVIDIYSGTQPTTADSAISGTLLGRVSIASTAYVAETPATQTITIAGASGSVNTVNVGTMNIIPLGSVLFNTSTAQTASDLCDAINRNGIYRATYPGSGSVVTVVSPNGTGVAHNGLAFSTTVTTLTATVGAATISGGVAATAGLTFGTPSAGTVSKTGVWGFNGLAIGTAGWFRMKASDTDANALSTTAVRLDGSIAVSGADMNMSNISIDVGAPSTIDTLSITMPAN